MAAPSTPADQPPNPDPHQDRPKTGARPFRGTSWILGIVRKLIDYGKQLAHTLENRTETTNLYAVTSNFGTKDIALILAHIARGLLRATALEARLVARAAQEDARKSAATAPAARSHRRPRPARPRAPRTYCDNPLLARLPSVEEIAAEIRRRPIGAVIEDICFDLGIVPADPLWREATEALMLNGGLLSRLFKATAERAFSWLHKLPPDFRLVPPMPPGWQPPPRMSFAEAMGIRPP